MSDNKLYIPQFKDGSGWTVILGNIPIFYEHIDKSEVGKLREDLKGRIFKIIYIDDDKLQPHKNSYFVKGEELNKFFQMGIDFYVGEEIVSIQEVAKIPSLKKKLKS